MNINEFSFHTLCFFPSHKGQFSNLKTLLSSKSRLGSAVKVEVLAFQVQKDVFKEGGED